MNIPQKIVDKILSGEMRSKHGLDTSSGSIYFNARMRGDSDVEAQYRAYKARRLLE